MGYTLKSIGYSGNSPDHREAIMYAISRAEDVKGLLENVRTWWKKSRHESEKSEFTLKKSSFSDAKRRTRERGEASPPRSPNADILFGYFMYAEEAPYRIDKLSTKVDQTTTEALVTRAVKDFFHRRSRDYEQLKPLEGDFIAYRPCWRTGDKNFLIRSHVSIKPEHGGYWLTEKQDFVADMPWEEDDNGVLFFAGRYAVCISSDADSSCFKTYVITYYEPDSEGKDANFIRGSVMAVSNHSEKHWAGPFAMIRKQWHKGPDDLKRVSVIDLKQQDEENSLLPRVLNHIETWEAQIEEGKASGVSGSLE